MMEQLISQKRVRFGGQGQEEFSRRTAVQQIESLRDNQEQGWFQFSFPRHMSQEYDHAEEMEFAVAVAAAASAINSLEEAEAEVEAKEQVERPRIIAESTTEGETWTRNSINGSGEKKHKVNSSRLNAVETWEKSQMEKIRTRYEKMKSSILAWEKEKKTQARRKYETVQADLEERKTRNERHCQAKMARIDQISGGARLQAEERRRKEELKVKENAKKMAASGSGRVSAKCFCF